jgi:glycogen debranching enzyme
MAADASRQLFLRHLADLARRSFQDAFWNLRDGLLYDCIAGTERDASVRPNQILAVSLPHALLEGERARRVVNVVRDRLLTPMGLRSLGPDHPASCPRYEGGVVERDSAYHQGTVWPWLLGPFVTAYVKVNEGSDEARAQAAAWLVGLASHFDTGCVGHIAEIADRDAPHRPVGCVAQAWSVAEVLRAVVEDVYAIRPAKQLAAAA